jgi:hypothetical protein
LSIAVGETIFRQYIENEWVPKEHKVIAFYVSKLANLGSNSSQRGESYHNVVRELTNAQLSLEESAKRLARKVVSIIKDIESDEAESARLYPRLAQSPVFRSLTMRITRYALEMLEVEWSTLTHLMAHGQQLPKECVCPILHRFGIACRHHLLRAFLENSPLPKTLLHPRWWLNGPPIPPINWAPFYPVQAAVAMPQLEQLGHQSQATELSQIRLQLNTEERHRFDSQIEQVHQNLLNIGHQRLALQNIPVSRPTPNIRSTYVKRTTHGRTNERGLTANEVLDRQERRQAQAIKRASPPTDTTIVLCSELPPRLPSPARNQELGEVDRVPESPVGQSTVILQRAPRPVNNTTEATAGGLPLVIRTPERPRYRHNPTPETHIALPPSTAPPELGGDSNAGGRGKRKKQPTAKAVELANKRRRG